MLCSTGPAGFIPPPRPSSPALPSPDGPAKEELKKRFKGWHPPHARGTGCSVSLPLDLVLLRLKIGIRVDENGFGGNCIHTRLG